MHEEEQLPHGTPSPRRQLRYGELHATLDSLLEGETDWTAVLSTVSCELHAAFEAFHWTGFYRRISPTTLAVGPYQGGHGCLRIELGRGVCGTVAKTGHTLLLDDVHSFPDHIACSATTRSEIVVPVFNRDGLVVAVLDIDSNYEAAFDDIDREALEKVTRMLTKYAPSFP